MQRIGTKYKPRLGNILLKSYDGQRLKSIEMTHHGDVEQVVYDIFQKWCTEEGDCSWEKLIQILKDSDLNTLATNIDESLL